MCLEGNSCVDFFCSILRILKETLSTLSSEINDQEAVATNYREIVAHFDRLERGIRTLDDSEDSLKRVLDDVNAVARQMDELRTRCQAPRTYVENSVEGSPTSSRRRRVVVLVTSQITTVITVIDEEIRKTIPTQQGLRNSLQQLRNEMNQLREQW